jgi:hypothetical protein
MSHAFFKSIQRHARQIRWLVRIPRTRRLRQQWLESQPENPTPAPKSCLLDIRRIAFDGEQGRRFHALVSLLTHGGYEVYVVPHLSFLQSANKEYKWQALQLTQPFDHRAAKRFDLCLSDQLKSHPAAKRTLRLAHDTSRPVHPNEIALPYSHHPSVWNSGEDQRFVDYRQQPRPWRLFFGGNFQQSAYRRIRKFTRIKPIDRYSLMNLAFDYFGDRTNRIVGEQQLANQQLVSCNGFVVIDSDVYRLPASRWLGVLATAEFFLAAPGCDYPFSHNCVEALAVGTIPILEYDQLFYPALQDGVNCITYRGAQGFIEAMERLENMSSTAVQALRVGAIAYYEEHLSPTAFTRLLENPDVQSVHVFPYLAKAS